MASVDELAPNCGDTIRLSHAILSLPPASVGDTSLAFLRRVAFDSGCIYTGLGDYATPDLALEAVRFYIKGELRPSSVTFERADEYGYPTTTRRRCPATDDLRNMAVECLDERAIPLLTDGLASEDAVMRRFCVEALGKIGSAKGRAQAIAALRDTDTIVRANACLAVARLCGADARGLLARMTHDPSPLVRFAARCIEERESLRP